MTEKKIIQQPLSMIPTFLQVLEGMLHENKKQLVLFESLQDKPHVLDDNLVKRSKEVFEDQQGYFPLHLNQCSLWRKETLSEEQLQSIEKIEKIIEENKSINERILFLLDHFSEHTIDKILKLTDEELALGVLSGKIYPPR